MSYINLNIKVSGELTNIILKNMPYKSTAYIYGALSLQNI